jgi:ABC-type glycerol-3-phosphate transport system substrate-binding protein
VKKVLTLILSIALLAGCFGVPAFAEANGNVTLTVWHTWGAGRG